MIYSIGVITRMQDNGDGGYTTYCYNSEEEMLEDHPLRRRFDSQTHSFYKVELTPQEREEILTEDDPYENGYIGSETIKIEIVDGQARLAESLSIHAGQ